MLSDIKIRTLKPRTKTYKVADGQALSISVTPKGGKSWYYRYRRPDGRQYDLHLGRYPELSLKNARRMRDDAKSTLANGRDPAIEKQLQKERLEDTFEAMAKAWIANHPEWSLNHGRAVRNRLEKWVFPTIGREAITFLTARIILEQCLRPIERHGVLETAHRVLGYIGQIMRFSIATGRAERDVTVDLKGALPAPQTQHYAAVTDPLELGGLLRAIDAYQGSVTVRIALQLTPLLLLRPGELRHLEWTDWSDEVIEIPAHRMKTRTAHIVPLASQVVTLLSDLRLFTGNQRFLFPSERGGGRPMSENAVRVALRSMGYRLTAHGFRATARTLLDEILNVRVDYIEQQLAHSVKDPLGRAYNRTKHLEQRRSMLQQWANYLDSLRAGGDFSGRQELS